MSVSANDHEEVGSVAVEMMVLLICISMHTAHPSPCLHRQHPHCHSVTRPYSAVSAIKLTKGSTINDLGGGGKIDMKLAWFNFLVEMV